LLIHGFGGDVENWMFNIDALSEKYRVFTFDLPGHGESYKGIDDASVPGYAKAVLAFMTAVGIQSANLVGHSMGGAIALQMLASAPERVLSLTLIASAAIGTQINQSYLEGFARANSRKELKPCVEMLFADPALASRKLLDDLLKAKRMDGAQLALEKTIASFATDGAQQLILIHLIEGAARPVLAIHGRRDQIIPVEQSESLRHAKVAILEAPGHMPHVEAAREVNALILEHLSKVN
jgi:pyruvate dehydrogenase E2 component (dihydrolipoamide acetyltransferase)